MRSTQRTRTNAAYWLADGFDELEDLGSEVKCKGQVPAWANWRQRLRAMPYEKLLEWAITREITSQERADALVLARQQLKAYRECLEYYLGPLQLDPKWENPTAHEFRNQKFMVNRPSLLQENLSIREVDKRLRQEEADKRDMQAMNEALGILRRFIPTERGQELLEAVREQELGFDTLKLMVAHLGDQLRNGTAHRWAGAKMRQMWAPASWAAQGCSVLLGWVPHGKPQTRARAAPGGPSPHHRRRHGNG